MRTVFRLSIIAIVAGAASGCISHKSYVDPSVQAGTYETVARQNDPLRLRIESKFLRNGEALPKADSMLHDAVERTLRGSGTVLPMSESGDGVFSVTLNNIADLGGAVAQGVGTGLTFGLAGTTVVDRYEMTVSITARGKTVNRSGVRHALYTAIGNTSTPEGVKVMSPAEAFQKVVESMLLSVLRDMQAAGDLPVAPPVARVSSVR